MPTFHPISDLINNTTTIDNGAHILYMYSEVDRYVENAVTYIYNGLISGAIVLFSESEEIIKLMKKQLYLMDLQDSHLENLICLSSNEFYLNGLEIDFVGAGKKFNSLLLPFIDRGHSIRTWGGVPLVNHESSLEWVQSYECKCDTFIFNHQMISVCAYNALTTSAYVQNELLKIHTHLMTDDLYNLSPLYNQDNHKQFSMNQKEELQKIERQYKHLKDLNARLAFENNLVKLKNDSIKQSEQKLRQIINALPIPIIIRRNSSVLFLNDEAREQFLTNNQQEELASFFHKYDDYLLVSPNSEELLEHQLSLKNDLTKYYLVNSINLLFEDEEAILHAFVDVTQEKENEKLMIRSEKMTIAGELAASIAHELRNPLTAVKGFFQMMKQTEEKVELYYNVIDAELSRIEQIASELLTLAKPHTDDRKDYNIVQLVEEVKLLLTSQTNLNNIEICLEADHREMFINCDNNKVKQVFINLIKNAVDAMNQGGTISIKIKENSDTITIQIIDQGKGIPKEVLNRIGEPFYTTKEKGTGIGLMVCYQIIESHKGTIHVASQVNVGTTFTITLPRSEQLLDQVN
ncbi:ATP-binding protein [Litchfieldia alkalitelluris]|uniref:ATP-binding protein n=1 Tax=Litchfieldia alkalitelluris TaxID=304268 RepID=UPI00099678B3|nr:ATP-binding protein [Litchfieldia alkalitelluris]